MYRLGGTGQAMKLDQWRIDRIISKVEDESRQTAAAVADD